MSEAVFRDVLEEPWMGRPTRLMVEPATWTNPPNVLADRERPVVLDGSPLTRYGPFEPSGAPHVTGPAFPVFPHGHLPAPGRPWQWQSVASVWISPDEVPARVWARASVDRTLAVETFKRVTALPTSRRGAASPREVVQKAAAPLLRESAPAAFRKLVEDRVEHHLLVHAMIAASRLDTWAREGRSVGAAEARLLRTQLADWSRHRDPRAGCVIPYLEWYLRAEPDPDHLEPFCCPAIPEFRRRAVRLLTRWPSDRLCLPLVAGLTGEPVSTRRDALLALVSAEDDRLRNWGMKLSAGADLSGPGRGR